MNNNTQPEEKQPEEKQKPEEKKLEEEKRKRSILLRVLFFVAATMFQSCFEAFGEDLFHQSKVLCNHLWEKLLILYENMNKTR
uniref:Uncharacterized protein n=1 Tax=Fagus sylvatica TaxID=28930 RepID=A0A2N9GMK8_FAGSY